MKTKEETEFIEIIKYEPFPDYILTTFSNGDVKKMPYSVDENGEEYIELNPKIVRIGVNLKYE